MSLKLSDEIALLALVIERAEGDAEATLLARLEFESLWRKFKKDSQGLYDAYTREARDEMAAQIASDIVDWQEKGGEPMTRDFAKIVSRLPPDEVEQALALWLMLEEKAPGLIHPWDPDLDGEEYPDVASDIANFNFHWSHKKHEQGRYKVRLRGLKVEPR